MPTRKERAFAAIARTSTPWSHPLVRPLSIPARGYRLGLDLGSIHDNAGGENGFCAICERVLSGILISASPSSRERRVEAQGNLLHLAFGQVSKLRRILRRKLLPSHR